MTSYLFRSYEANAAHIQPEIRVDNASLNIDKGVPCGLIINELVSNSLKHAFDTGCEGKIWVDFRVDHPNDNGGLNTYELCIRDNGRGLYNFDIRNATSLGLKLVSTLVKQIKGELTINNKKGTEFRITFKG